MRNAVMMLVEDSVADQTLIREALKETDEETQLVIAADGVDALNQLRARRKSSEGNFPDLIILDLLLPKKNNYEVLREIRRDPDLTDLVIAIFTSWQSEDELKKVTKLRPDFLIGKPVDLDQYFKSIHAIERFCLDIIKAPERFDECADELRRRAA